MDFWQPNLSSSAGLVWSFGKLCGHGTCTDAHSHCPSLFQPQSLAAFSTPAMGCSLFILDNDGNPLVNSMEIEQVCNGVDDAILETAAICVPPSGGGPEQLVVVVVFKD